MSHLQKKSQAADQQKNHRHGYVDPGWPKNIPAGKHAVTELIADTAGALSPYGDIVFPVDPSTLPYVHPYTVVNK